MSNNELSNKSEKSFNKKNKKRKRWLNLFKDKFIDLVIVIVSILIAYELTLWQTESDHRSAEEYYLDGIVTDLDKDITELEGNLESLRRDSILIARYVQRMNEWPDDSLANVIMNVLSFETFQYNNNTYQSLLSGNGLNTFSDRVLRTMITEYYNVYVPIFRFEEIYTQIVLKINDHFLEDVDYFNRRFVPSHPINKITSRNYLLLALDQLADAVEAYEDSLRKARAVKQHIADRES